jgi:hypothetical protein
MPTTPQYDQLLADLAAGQLNTLEHQVLELLTNVPQGLTRYDLLEKAFGPEARQFAEERGLANSTDDRKIRETIESLRNKGVPIVSSSGKAGYRLDTSQEAVGAMIAEWQSRINNLQERIRTASRFHHVQLPVKTAPASRPAQGRLF